MSDFFPTLMPGAEPFFYRGSAVGCLCLHGFTASPAEVRWLGQHLSERGFTVYGPRLPGHGIEYHQIARQRWQDWYAEALSGYYLLRAQCEKVFVVGHSMGGMLALLLAGSVPLDGVAALATPVLFHSRTMKLARWLKYVMPYTDQTDHSPLQETVRAEQDRRNEPVRGRIRYDQWSTAAVAELYALGDVVYQRLPQVTTPLLLVYSTNDPTVGLENRDSIVHRVKSSVVECQTLEKSQHISTQDVEHEQVFAWVGDFIGLHSNGNG